MDLINHILLEAGYFRASIESLSDFDKIIGGMAWAMQLFRYEITIDIYYADSLNLGQKILLTERLVMVLIIMNCPHQIQPHQIVGLDYVNIVPVIKWLIGRFTEVRREHLNRYLESQAPLRRARSLPDEDDEYQIITYNDSSAATPTRALNEQATLSKSLEDVKQMSKRTTDTANQCPGIEDQGFPREAESAAANATSDYSAALGARLAAAAAAGSSREAAREDYEEGRVDANLSAPRQEVAEEKEEEEEDKELHAELDSQLAATNQEILELVRRLDSVPSRLEIEQYQSRYIELHQQLIAQSRDLRNLYALFNTLDSSKHYLTKEINLLDSVLANLPLLDRCESNKSLLITQLQSIIIKIKSVRQEVVAKLDSYKQKYDLLISEYNRVY